jgi:hypothetical protein
MFTCRKLHVSISKREDVLYTKSVHYCVESSLEKTCLYFGERSVLCTTKGTKDKRV